MGDYLDRLVHLLMSRLSLLGSGFATPGGSPFLSGLIAYWTLDEASGTRVDAHGNNDLSDNNTVTSTTGKVGDAAAFATANSEYLSRADNADLSVGNIDFTFDLWLNLSTA